MAERKSGCEQIGCPQNHGGGCYILHQIEFQAVEGNGNGTLIRKGRKPEKIEMVGERAKKLIRNSIDLANRSGCAEPEYFEEKIGEYEDELGIKD